MRNEDGHRLPEILIVGPENSPRVATFADTAHRCGAPRVQAVSYLDVIHGNCESPRPGTLIRLESPGGCPATIRAFLKAGIAAVETERRVPISSSEIDNLTCHRGEMLHPRQWFLGLREIMRDIDARWSQPDVHWMTTPESVISAFDKAECLARWSSAGLPIPRQYPAVSTYAELRRQIPERHARIFIKLRYGYSAMGAVALEWRDDRVRAITTVETAWANGRPRLFVTKRPQQLRREFEIAWLIDTLAMEQIIVEDWLPKAHWEGRPYDLRVIMIQGRVQHIVGRSSASPFTNLNLDARRIPREVVVQQLGDSYASFNTLCEQAAAVFPDAGMLGLDVLVGPHHKKFAILEANAFGDYLPGLLHEGRTTYEAELHSEYLAHPEFCR
ncbi:MAG: STM4014 family protein [Planctomycetota bacterium]